MEILMSFDLTHLLPSTITLKPRSLLTTGTRYTRVSHFPSRKNQAPIGCTALQHSDFCVLLEFDPRISRYASRPCRIEFKESGRIYKPDFCSIFGDARVVFYSFRRPSIVSQADGQHQLTEEHRQFSEAGLTLELITLSDIGQTQRAQNLRYLYHHALKGSTLGATAVSNAVAAQGEKLTKVSALLAEGHTPEDIAYAIFYQQVVADLDRRFTLETVVRGQ
jgi:hypothetical protein